MTGSTIRYRDVEHRTRARGANGDEPRTIIVLGANIVRRLGVNGALEALHNHQTKVEQP